MDIDDGRLIELVRLSKIIYDRSDNLFKNKIARRNIWRSIAQELNRTEKDCEQRWNVLRTRYNTEIRNMKKLPSSEGGVKRKWFFFDDMSFLDEHIIKKKTSSYISEEKDTRNDRRFNETMIKLNSESSESLDIKDNPIEFIAFNSSELKDVNRQNSLHSIDNVIESSSLSIPSTSKTENPLMSETRTEATKKEIKHQNPDFLLETISSAVDSISSFFKNKQETLQENADICFCKQIYYYLQEIENEKQKKKIKRKILDVFIDEDN